MSEAVIVDAVRTPIGRAIEGRWDVRATTSQRSRCARLSSATRRSISGRPTDVMMGCGFPDHEQGYNVGRNAVLLAGMTTMSRRSRSAGSAHRRCRRSGWPSTRSRRAKATSTSRRAWNARRAAPA